MEGRVFNLNIMKETIILLVGIILGVLFNYNLATPKVDLPEEYQLITEDTPIKGHFEGKTLVIEFNHQYK